MNLLTWMLLLQRNITLDLTLNVNTFVSALSGVSQFWCGVFQEVWTSLGVSVRLRDESKNDQNISHRTDSNLNISLKWQTRLKVFIRAVMKNHYEMLNVNQSCMDSSEFNVNIVCVSHSIYDASSPFCASWTNPSSKPSWLKNATRSLPTEG